VQWPPDDPTGEEIVITRKLAAIALACGVAAFGLLTPASAAPQPTVQFAQQAQGQGRVLTDADLPRQALLPDEATKSAAAAAPGECTGSWVYLIPSGGTSFRTAPDATNPANVAFSIASDNAWLFPCRKLVVGGRYQACGVTNANGWILVQDWTNLAQKKEFGWSFYVPSVCMRDNS
jgi:hypothetical protein